MSWPICISAWREAISKACRTPMVKSAATSLGICVVLATPLAISWWCGGRQVQAGAAIPETEFSEVNELFELPLPTSYRDELKKPDSEIKSGYVYLDLIQRLEMISADLKKNQLTAEASTVSDIARKLSEDAGESPWRIKDPVYDDRSIWTFSIGLGR